jgi:hypothetical protein
VRAFGGRAIRAAKLIVRDGRIPKPLRWLAGLALLPIPGPFDEAVLLILAPILFAFYRAPMREAWRQAGPAIDGRAERSNKARRSRFRSSP